MNETSYKTPDDQRSTINDEDTGQTPMYLIRPKDELIL